MTEPLFDMRARALRRDRAARTGPALFAHDRAFEDIIDRLAIVRRTFESALLVGSANPQWSGQLAAIAPKVTVVDPAPLFAQAAGGQAMAEDALDVEPGSFDLVVAIGTLDTVNDLPGALLRLRFALRPDGLLIGAMSGGATLPRLRDAMRAADAVSGGASPHIHPRIEPGALAGLLSAAGFAMPVVDVDRLSVSYRDFASLVRDLRAMGATNILSARPRRPVSRIALAAAAASFSSGEGERTVETFEILHFTGWSPAEQG
ncbi:methyltransferase domain-containing protein [Sphingomonas sabuli]|uniref:Methyltransferase domain-containing protein n=1 Tax=Sphingomonas sabuli TaxID=2764186 RepID=A0A7G9L231_9SPHN|nr:methyltransferase domain-containing protein [Sphingomonas sabuli]QNM82680.1 methyltransferase domain-containing protein [Sphingomonas sabuli]